MEVAHHIRRDVSTAGEQGLHPTAYSFVHSSLRFRLRVSLVVMRQSLQVLQDWGLNTRNMLVV
jgi:hypothetical protein